MTNFELYRNYYDKYTYKQTYIIAYMYFHNNKKP